MLGLNQRLTQARSNGVCHVRKLMQRMTLQIDMNAKVAKSVAGVGSVAENGMEDLSEDEFEERCTGEVSSHREAVPVDIKEVDNCGKGSIKEEDFRRNNLRGENQMASTARAAAVPTGCYKCGRPGHWSKDCPVNPAKTPAGGGAAGRPPASGEFSGASGGRVSNSGGFKGENSWRGKPFEGNTSQGRKNVPKEIIKEPRKRPKLTADLLLSEEGLGYVLEKMPEMVTIKGREDTVVRDLKSLIEGYMHWHSLVLPYFSFDQFVQKVGDMGASKRVRMCARELRDKIANRKGSSGDEEREAEATGGSSPKNNPAQDTPAKPETEEESQGRSPPNDIFTNQEPEFPVNDDEFEDFFRQGVVEPSDTVNRGSAPSGVQRNVSPVRKFPSLEDDGPTIPPTAPTSITINESAAARMEANRLQALERAKSRLAKTGQI